MGAKDSGEALRGDSSVSTVIASSEKVVEVKGLLVAAHAPGCAVVEHLLQRRVGHRRDDLEQRAELLSDGRHRMGVLVRGAEADDDQRVAQGEVVLFGDRRQRRSMQGPPAGRNSGCVSVRFRRTFWPKDESFGVFLTSLILTGGVEEKSRYT